MGLLADIQMAAADDSVSLSSVLRRCQILASRLSYTPFKEWVGNESNGYPPHVELPEYRVMHGVPSKADFIGPTHKVSNYPVPPNLLPDEELRRLIGMMTLRDGVAEYEAMLTEAKGHPGGAIKNPWPGDMAQQLLHMQGMHCIEAWQELPMSAVAGMLSQIRNRLLAFTLEIEQSSPDLGERSATEHERQTVAATYQTIILGGSQTIVHGGRVEQHITIEQGDVAGLILALKDLGVPAGDIRSLTQALDEDRSEGEPLGHKTQAWLADAGKQIAAGAWQVGVASASEVIAGAVRSYLGIH